MKQLLFSTGNILKFGIARHVCERYDIGLNQSEQDITEIQSEDPRAVALDKAYKAFEILQQPVVTTDDSWTFSGLRGFPGVYMHSVNKWFTPEDFLRLTLPLEDRSATLTQLLVYTDGHARKVFTRQSEGIILKEIRGHSPHPSHTIVSMVGDKGRSIAEAYDHTADTSDRKAAQVWHDFAQWYQKI
jgi:inosine/xanthosine triphosphate pyrophosphatase family protein